VIFTQAYSFPLRIGPLHFHAGLSYKATFQLFPFILCYSLFYVLVYDASLFEFVAALVVSVSLGLLSFVVVVSPGFCFCFSVIANRSWLERASSNYMKWDDNPGNRDVPLILSDS